jgi:SAM-dependent methyltransferase
LINNTDDYVSLMRDRASGALPDMGSALRVVELVRGMADGPVSVLDVGCAAGHFLRTFKRQGVALSKYVGLEIDPMMVAAANSVWAAEIHAGDVQFINEDLERFDRTDRYDFVICVNAFMYFASAAAALTRLLKAVRGRLLVRSYFSDANYRIIRAQTRLNHDKSNVEEIDVFDADGNMVCYDFWNIYSQTFIEASIARIDPAAKIEWIEDRNVLSSLAQERELDIKKRGATEVVNGQEISYPFILPWKYLSVTMDRG